MKKGWIISSPPSRDSGDQSTVYLSRVDVRMFNETTMLWTDDIEEAIFFETEGEAKVLAYTIWDQKFVKDQFNIIYYEHKHRLRRVK